MDGNHNYTSLNSNLKQIVVPQVHQPYATILKT